MIIQEVEFEVNNLLTEWGGRWDRLLEVVNNIGRAEVEADLVYLPWDMATAKVHLIVNDDGAFLENALMSSRNLSTVVAPHITGVRDGAFSHCKRLSEVVLPSTIAVGRFGFNDAPSLTIAELPNVISIEMQAFAGCFALRHVTLPPNDGIFTIEMHAFSNCISLHALAASTNFVKRTNETETELLTRYLIWRNENDRQREQFHTMKVMLELCSWHIDKDTGETTGEVRCTPHDILSNFLFENEDPAKHILSFFGEKRGKGDLRDASVEKLHAVALELNSSYKGHWWWTNKGN